MTIRSPLAAFLLAAWINACAPPEPLPEAESVVRDLYRRALPIGEPAPMSRPLPEDRAIETSFTAETDRRLRREFRVQPNPGLILYVYPHLTADRIPVPGYATRFHAFERGPILKVAR